MKLCVPKPFPLAFLSKMFTHHCLPQLQYGPNIRPNYSFKYLVNESSFPYLVYILNFHLIQFQFQTENQSYGSSVESALSTLLME